MRRLRRAHQKFLREQAKKHKNLKQKALAAGAATAIALGSGAGLHKAIAAVPPDQHHLPVAQDYDTDLLSDSEETAIGYQPFEGDQNKNLVQDGAELANRCAAIIDNLPWREEALPGQTYKWLDPTYGLETCDICGETVNMGPAGIVNPTLGIDVNCPLIAIHYMQHGSFSYAGNVHNGRIDVPLLLRALENRFPYEPNEHQLQLYTPDNDGDLLDDNEELKSNLNMYDADQDDDITPDGIELAKQCAKVIEESPVWDGQGQEPNEIYVFRLECDGLEQCDICGQWIHMCGGKIVNPKLGLNYPDANDPMSTEFLPDLALHYMSHGSFSLAGSDHTGRVNIPLLMQVLEMPQQCGHLGTIYLPGDFNKDCKENFSDFADFANKWLESTDPAEQ